jgi:hypothetical protein
VKNVKNFEENMLVVGEAQVKKKKKSSPRAAAHGYKVS